MKKLEIETKPISKQLSKRIKPKIINPHAFRHTHTHAYSHPNIPSL